MVEEVEEGEGTSRSGSVAVASAAAADTDARSFLPPRKRLLANLKQNGWASAESASSASSVRLRKRTPELPTISDCHACGARMKKKGKDKLLTLDSQWRVVLLCKKCFDGVESTKICSYCFMKVSEESAGCRECQRRIHRACILKYPGFSPCSNSGSVSFKCIDCWVPKPPANSNGAGRSKNPSGDSKILSDACSVGNSRVSAPQACSKSLEDVMKDANLAAEKKIAAATLAREKAFTKAVAARRAAELARSALSLAVVASRENREKDSPASCASMDDAELALRLHRAINSSPRIAKNLCSLNSDCLQSPRIWHCTGNASDPGSPSVCGKLEACTENKLFENPDKTISEPSVRIASSDHDSSNDLRTLGENTKVEKDSSPQVKQCKDCGEDSVIVTSEEMFKAGPLKILDSKENKVEPPMKEDEASCSNKFVKSSGDDNSTDSGSQSYQKKDESEYNKVSHNVGNMCQLSCEGDSSMLKKKRSSDSDRYLRKYSKRNSSLKAVLDCKTKFLYEDLPLESQASATGLPCLQLNCSKALRTFSDASFQSPSVPLQASAYESGPSGNQL
ncbi:uncharacterized protein LOC122073703 [Macadamia integrifolia]|uniref:uncharacterized protein LOC122073703 n=1 Tax=Macadamia integrifolia TaxID=60698 RepID=UPI001C4FEB10|nr:uncharacterized protein LOC122073703 [Macadamia integrifolia]